ncbi:hypothetical protein HOD29_06480 [archaeon]|jgi:hypothetical protein|nr:hypothetical protein [archaeon]
MKKLYEKIGKIILGGALIKALILIPSCERREYTQNNFYLEKQIEEGYLFEKDGVDLYKFKFKERFFYEN